MVGIGLVVGTVASGIIGIYAVRVALLLVGIGRTSEKNVYYCNKLTIPNHKFS